MAAFHAANGGAAYRVSGVLGAGEATSSGPLRSRPSEQQTQTQTQQPRPPLGPQATQPRPLRGSEPSLPSGDPPAPRPGKRCALSHGVQLQGLTHSSRQSWEASSSFFACESLRHLPRSPARSPRARPSAVRFAPRPPRPPNRPPNRPPSARGLALLPPSHSGSGTLQLSVTNSAAGPTKYAVTAGARSAAPAAAAASSLVTAADVASPTGTGATAALVAAGAVLGGGGASGSAAARPTLNAPQSPAVRVGSTAENAASVASPNATFSPFSRATDAAALAAAAGDGAATPVFAAGSRARATVLVRHLDTSEAAELAAATAAAAEASGLDSGFYRSAASSSLASSSPPPPPAQQQASPYAPPVLVPGSDFQDLAAIYGPVTRADCLINT